MTFTLIRKKEIESLHVEIEEYEHKKTGARHLHINANNDENVFLVALRTVPKDSTGVAHILEHTALCGSERYPVRDPFFMMIRRSLNTFMNAFTSSDWTAYPFASKNRKDFDNLLDVYLDSVFFSQLDELDFAQEGHRVEFAEPDNPESDLVYKGVVYNEMKGAMSSPVSQLWQTLTKYVFPSTTYHHNSGGEPDHIPDLSYAQLKSFYKKHYHPSNAVFMTYGDIPAETHQKRFEDQVLKRFDKQVIDTCIPDEKRYFSPVMVRESYPLSEIESEERKTHVVMGWLLGHSFNLEENLEAHLLSNVLFENSASPLQRALETSDLGHAPSPLCGLEDSNREMTFVCGLEGCDSESVIEIENLVLTTLQKIADEGVPLDRIEAVLHQLELSQREVSGDGYPYGLQLILGALSPALHGGDPIELLDLEPVLASLRQKIADPDFIKNLVRKLLLDNPHRVTLSLVPCKQLEKRREQNRIAKLAEIKKALTEAEKKLIVNRAALLNERQLRKDDDTLLPKVTVADVPHHLFVSKGQKLTKNVPITAYKQGTNGLVYQQLVIDLPALNDAELSVLPVYTYCLTELGCADKDYLEMQDWQSSVTGGITAYSSIKGAIDDEQAVKGYLVLSGKALARNQKPLTELLKSVLASVRFDESERIKELVAHIRTKREQGVTSNGHALAMGAACSKMSPTAKMSYQLGGLLGIVAIKKLDDQLKDPAALNELCNTLTAIHQKVAKSARQFLIVAEPESLDTCVDTIAALWSADTGAVEEGFSLPAIRESVKHGWITSTQVNFCSKAYKTVPVEHADAPALSVLGHFMRNGYLHRAVREQGGAYGGGAGQDSAISAFRFYSYRDPRLTETLNDFDKAIDWVINNDHEYQELEESILGVVSQIDKPKSPAGEAKSAFHNELFGRTHAQREHFRKRVLAVTLDDLKRVCATYLKAEASIGVVSNEAHQAELEALGLELHVL
ncbi:MAG: insulinase family protein [Hahellaceae bacterium]|nr:insulinase family protein [Hahellaceae bacterium]MCP5212135.1 insulinase family protein [Hahellaceae bacterium]